MRNLYKFLLAIALIALTFAASSWWLGKKVQAQYQDILQAWLPADAAAYQRGIFSSSSAFTLHVPILPETIGLQSEDTLSIQLENKIHHGPFPGSPYPAAARIETQITDIQGPGSSWLKAAQLDSMQITTLIGFDGEQTGHLLLPAGSLEQGSGRSSMYANWDDFNYHYVVSADGGTLAGHAVLEQMDWRWGELSAPLAKAQMQDLQMDFNFHPLPNLWLLMPGHVEASIQSFSLETQEADARLENQIHLQNMSMRSDTRHRDMLLDNHYRLQAQGRVGPFQFQQLEHEARYENLSTQALLQLQDNLDDDHLSELASSNLTEQIAHAFLQAHPRLQQNLKLTRSDGDSAQLELQVQLQNGPDARLPLFFSWPQIIQAEGRVQWPQSWLPELAQAWDENVDTLLQTVQELVQQGYILQENGHYHSQASFKDGRLRINGRSMM